MMMLDSPFAELPESKRHLAEALKVARVGSWEYDPASGKITWSSVLFELMGRDRRQCEPTYEELVEMIHPADRPLLEESVRLALTEGKPYRFDYRIVPPCDSVRHLAATGEPVFDAAGKVVRLFGTVLDITERKRAEEKLRESEARFRVIFEAARDAVFLADTETGVIVDVNLQGERLIGRPRGEIIGMHQWQLHPPEEDTSSREFFVRHVATEGAAPVVHRVTTADGRLVPVEINASIIELAPGKKCLMGIFRDITERKKTEEEILALNRDLRQWGAELASMNRDLEAFNYSLSHDLKIPLTCISVAAERLQESVSGERCENFPFFVSTILSESERMEELLEAMLLLSRVSRAEIWHEEVDLSAMVSEVLHRLKSENPQRRVEWDIATGIIVSGDARLLMAAMENLVGNAWKYTGRKEVARIEFGVMEVGGRAFFIRDNGAGFDMTHSQGLFEPFKRLHADDIFKGTGVGLTTVQRIIQRHGGRIWAQAEPEKGAAFFFTLPSAIP